jgi:hypothetical protein
MNNYLKINLLGLYLLALVSLVIELPWGSGPYLQRISLILLAIHAVETVVMFKDVKRYQGPLVTSVVLSLLFGLLHWLPLRKAAQK